MKRLLVVAVVLIGLILGGCSFNGKSNYETQTHKNVTFGEMPGNSESLQLTGNFESDYRFVFSYTGREIDSSNVWIQFDLGDETLRLSLINRRQAEIVEDTGAVNELKMVSNKEGLSEQENTIYYNGTGFVSSWADNGETEYNITVQICRYGDKILGKIYQPALDIFNLASEAMIYDFIYIAPESLPDEISFCISGKLIKLHDIEYVNYPTLTQDPEGSMWPNEKFSDKSGTDWLKKLLVFIGAVAVGVLFNWVAGNYHFNKRLMHLQISSKKCITLSVSIVIVITGLSYTLNPNFHTLLHRKFNLLLGIRYTAPLAGWVKWLNLVLIIVSLITISVIVTDTLLKGKKSGKGPKVLLYVLVAGALYLPAVHLIWSVALEVLKGLAPVAGALVLVWLLGSGAEVYDFTPKHMKATITDADGNQKVVDVIKYGDDPDLYLKEENGTTRLVPDGHGGYKDADL